MPIAQTQYPIRFTPRGLTDALDATDKFPGACIKLTNLIFDQSNPENMVPRPGVGDALTSFSGFTTPGAISVQITVGTRTYGMIASGLNGGKDQPFSYNHATDTFDTVSGITNANSPTSQATTGAWTPPTMAVIGTRIVVTHPGFAGGGVMIGNFDISTVGSPAWAAGDLATNALPSVPTAVANFFNRAYYACGQYLVFSDVLVPLTRTNSTQVLTLGDTTDVIALSGLPLQTTSSGITAALLAFKNFQVWQITGDAATSDLALNFLSLTTGCVAPRSIAPSQKGVYFASINGPYIVNPLGAITKVTNSDKDADSDIDAAFQNAVEPTRIAGGYSAGMYRVCIENTIRLVQDKRDYWFSESRRRWTGPHTFTYDCSSNYKNYFILCSNDTTAKLFASSSYPALTSSYEDNGDAINVAMETSSFVKTNHMNMNQVVESTIELASAGSNTTFTISALNELGENMSSAQIPVDGAGPIWGLFVWEDGSVYSSSSSRPVTYSIDWTVPLVFKKLSLYIAAVANYAIGIGTFFARYQDAGYTNDTATSQVDILTTEEDVFIRV